MTAERLAPELQDRLITEHEAMANRLARRYSHGSETDPDLAQVAMYGLVSAARRYDPDVGPFRPFAVATVLGELKKHLRVAGWAVHVPRRVQEASITVDRAAEQLEQRLRRSPTTAELAEATGLSPEDVLLGIMARQARFNTVAPGSGSGIIDPFEGTIDAIDLDRARRKLDRPERTLLQLHYERGLTQREIAAELGMSQPQVHRRLTRAVQALADLLKAEVDPETDPTPSSDPHPGSGKNGER